MTTEAYVKLSADASGVAAGVAQANAELQKLPPVAEILRRKFDTVTEGVNLTRLQVLELQREFKTFGADGAAASDKVAGAAHGSAGALRETLVLIREASNQNWTRFAGSASLLAQYSGALSLVMTPLGAAIAAAGLAVAGFGVAAATGAGEVKKFNDALTLTNGAAGLTASRFQTAAVQIASSTRTGVGPAKAALTELAATGQFSGQTLVMLGYSATRMAQLSGKSAEDVVKDFSAMREGVTKFAVEYQARYGQLTAAQIDYIRKLEQQGDKERAQQALAKDLYDFYGKTAPQDLGALEKAWNGLTGAIGGAWEAMKGFGREKTPQERLDELIKARNALRFQMGNKSNTEYDAPIARAEQLLRNEAAINAMKAEGTARQKEGAAAAEFLARKFEESKVSGEKLKTALAEIDQNLRLAVAADPGRKAELEKQAEAVRAQARQSFTPKAAAPKNRTGEWRDELDQKLIAEKKFFDDSVAIELEFWRKKAALPNLTKAERLAAGREVYTLERQTAREALDRQIEDIKAGERAKADALQARSSNVKQIYNEQVDAIRVAEAQGLITKKAATQQIVALTRQEVADQIALIDKLHAVKVAALNAELAADKAAGKDTTKVWRDVVVAEGEYERQRAQVGATGARLIARENLSAAQAANAGWKASINQIGQSWKGTLNQMLTGQMTFAQGVKGLWNGIAGAVASALTDMVAKWAAQQAAMMAKQAAIALFGKGVKTAEAAGKITANAGVAGSAALASTAAIPIIGPGLAPAAGAAAFAAALGYLPTAAASQGFDVGNQSPVTRLHPREMVLPEHLADNVRNMGKGGGRGDVQVHIHATDAQSVARLFKDNGKALAATLRDMQRNGLLTA